MNTTPAHSGLPHTYYFSNSVQPITILCACKENKHKYITEKIFLS